MLGFLDMAGKALGVIETRKERYHCVVSLFLHPKNSEQLPQKGGEFIENGLLIGAVWLFYR